MIKVAMIGAGSVVFARKLTGDILCQEPFADATIHYMDIDAERLECAGLMGRKVAESLGVPATILTTQDRREALRGADFVINMVQIGGFDSTLVDFEIPRSYGLNFTIADTTGPGALFRALRTYPVLTSLAQDMEELCPAAVLLNYANPMAMNMQAVFRTSSIRAVGLCHSVQNTFDGLMHYLEIDPAEANFTCAGINHMAFYLRLERGGEDLYPRLFALAENERIFSRNKVRFELMKRLGYFVTESSEHHAEYSAHFIPHGREQIDSYAVPIDEYLQRSDRNTESFEETKQFARSDKALGPIRRSHEYGSTIIHAMVTGTPAVVYGNLPNRGAITNLPADAVVETATLVDRSGLQPTRIGELPPQLVGYIQPHVIQHELFIRAALEGRRDHVYQACMMDPLTAAMVTPDRIVAMCDELITAHGELLPPLDAPLRIPTSGRTFHPPSAQELRSRWDAAKAESERDFVKSWQLIGPIAGDQATLDLDTGTAVEQLLIDGADLDQAVIAQGTTYPWQVANPQHRGFVDLSAVLGRHEFSIAYAVHEWEEVHGRSTELSCGSDDAIRIWLDGQEVLAWDGTRGYREDSNATTITLAPGIHRLLVKIVNYEAGWGFGVKLPPADQ